MSVVASAAFVAASRADSRVLDVRRFASVQAALDAAASEGGGTVFIPPGETDAGEVALPSSTRLLGAGAASILKGSLVAEDAAQVDVRDVSIDATGHDHGIAFTTVIDATLVGVRVRSATSHNLYFEDVARCSISHLYTTGAGGDGMHIEKGGAPGGTGENSHPFLITNAYFANNAGNGLRSDGTHDLKLLGSVAERNGLNGFLVIRPIETVITGCGSEYNSQGSAPDCGGLRIEIADPDGYGVLEMMAVVTGYISQNNPRGVVIVAPGSANAFRYIIDVRGNTLYTSNGSYEGVKVVGHDDANGTINIVNNTISSQGVQSQKRGIYLTQSDVGGVTIARNLISKHNYGIYLPSPAGGSKPTIIEDNVFEGNTVGQDIRVPTSGTMPVIRRNTGYATEASGTGAIEDQETTSVVTHGLAGTPTSVTVTARGVAALGVTARDATTFTVERAGDSGQLAFDWRAEFDPAA